MSDRANAMRALHFGQPMMVIITTLVEYSLRSLTRSHPVWVMSHMPNGPSLWSGRHPDVPDRHNRRREICRLSGVRERPRRADGAQATG